MGLFGRQRGDGEKGDAYAAEDLPDIYRDLSQDYPVVDAGLIPDIYALSPDSIDTVQDNIHDFSVYVRQHGETGQAVLFQRFFTDRIDRTIS